MLIFHHPSYTRLIIIFGTFVNDISLCEYYFTIQQKSQLPFIIYLQHSLHNLNITLSAISQGNHLNNSIFYEISFLNESSNFTRVSFHFQHHYLEVIGEKNCAHQNGGHSHSQCIYFNL